VEEHFSGAQVSDAHVLGQVVNFLFWQVAEKWNLAQEFWGHAGFFLREGLVEALNFEQVAVGVFEKAMVNAKFGVVRRGLGKFDPPGLQARVPAIYILADEGQDEAWGRGGFEVLTKAEVSIAADPVDAAKALVADEFKPEDLFVKAGCIGQVCGAQKGDALLKGGCHGLILSWATHLLVSLFRLKFV
jgi:hypothetical protein